MCEYLDRGPSLPAHALLETYSVVTGFAPPYRVPAALVVEWLDDRLVTILSAPAIEEQRALIRSLGRAVRIGGAVYHAFVGLTAKTAGATLITADRRALTTSREEVEIGRHVDVCWLVSCYGEAACRSRAFS